MKTFLELLRGGVLMYDEVGTSGFQVESDPIIFPRLAGTQYHVIESGLLEVTIDVMLSDIGVQINIHVAQGDMRIVVEHVAVSLSVAMREDVVLYLVKDYGCEDLIGLLRRLNILRRRGLTRIRAAYGKDQKQDCG